MMQQIQQATTNYQLHNSIITVTKKIKNEKEIKRCIVNGA